MKHKLIQVGSYQVNCSILVCEKTKEAVIIDPGSDAHKIDLEIKDYKVKYLLHTHAHFDHIGATRKLKEVTKAKILLHKADLFLYENIKEQASFFGEELEDSLAVDQFIEDQDTLGFGEKNIKVIHTPGHTPGGCCFLVDDLLIAGDTLFKGSIGRTDLPGGNHKDLLASIKDKLLTLNRDYKVIPGHGPNTSLFQEKLTNPFLITE